MKENAHDMFFGSWYNLEDGSGVYAIVNSLDNKKYIGSTGTLRKRFRQHYSALIKGEHGKKGVSQKRSKHVKNLEKPICKYSLDGQLIEEFPSVMDAARTLGNPNTTRVSIKRCYQGKQKSAYGYIWKLKNTQNDR